MLISLSPEEVSLVIRAISLVRLDDQEFTREEQAGLREVIIRMDQVRAEDSEATKPNGG